MLKIHLTFGQVMVKALTIGVLTSLVGSVVFATFEFLGFLILSLPPINSIREVISYQLDSWILVSKVAFFLTFLPNIVAGILMMAILVQWSQIRPVFTKQAVIVGSCLGLSIVLVIGLFMGLFIDLVLFRVQYEAEVIEFFLRSLVIAFIVGGGMGGLAGYLFIKPMLGKQQKVLSTAGDNSVHFTAETPL